MRKAAAQAGSGVINSRPKQKPLRDRTMAGTRDRLGVSNSISSKSPGFSKMPAYNTIPPSLSSVPRPSTTVVEKPLDVTTRTGMSTGRRFQRRVFPDGGIVPNHRSYCEVLQITKVKYARVSYRPTGACWRFGLYHLT